MTAIPSTDLRGQVLCTLPLPYARLLVSPDGELSHITAPLVFMSSILVFKVSVQVTSLDCLPLTVSRLVFLGYTGLWQSETQSLIDYHPQVLHRQEAERHPQSLWKTSVFLSWSFGQMGKLQVWHTPTGLWSYSQRTQARGCHLYVLPLTHYVSPVSLKKELIHLSRALIFMTATQGKPPDCRVLVTSGAYDCGPTGLDIFAYFKSCCLWESGFQSAWI